LLIKTPVSIGALRKLTRELRAAGGERKPVGIGGGTEIARTLERELARGGESSAVKIGDPEGSAIYVHVETGDDEPALKRARRARVPIVAVIFDDTDLPYVYATDVVRVGPGERLPVERIAEAIAARLGAAGAPLAARLPALRRAVCERIVASFARKNGLAAAALFVPGADLPVLTLNEVRMLLLLDQAYGLELDPQQRLPEILATIGAGLGLRAVARELLDVVPVAGWAVKGGVAYAGTRALGQAAVRRLESVH
jgi:uncharacterized protein (DUF697 family)